VPLGVEMLGTNSSRIRFWSIFAAAICLCSMRVDARRAPPAPATGTFNHIVFNSTNGRVGYHMFASFGVYDWDEPTGVNATCHPAVGNLSVAGTLPPGLTLQTAAQAYGFDGTPRQPGDWTVNVTIDRIACKAGPDQTVYGPRNVAVHFHIDP
jgi:hypothetical protein